MISSSKLRCQQLKARKQRQTGGITGDARNVRKRVTPESSDISSNQSACSELSFENDVDAGYLHNESYANTSPNHVPTFLTDRTPLSMSSEIDHDIVDQPHELNAESNNPSGYSVRGDENVENTQVSNEDVDIKGSFGFNYNPNFDKDFWAHSFGQNSNSAGKTMFNFGSGVISAYNRHRGFTKPDARSAIPSMFSRRLDGSRPNREPMSLVDDDNNDKRLIEDLRSKQESKDYELAREIEKQQLVEKREQVSDEEQSAMRLERQKVERENDHQLAKKMQNEENSRSESRSGEEDSLRKSITDVETGILGCCADEPRYDEDDDFFDDEEDAGSLANDADTYDVNELLEKDEQDQILTDTSDMVKSKPTNNGEKEVQLLTANDGKVKSPSEITVNRSRIMIGLSKNSGCVDHSKPRQNAEEDERAKALALENEKKRRETRERNAKIREDAKSATAVKVAAEKLARSRDSEQVTVDQIANSQSLPSSMRHVMRKLVRYGYSKNTEAFDLDSAAQNAESEEDVGKLADLLHELAVMTFDHHLWHNSIKRSSRGGFSRGRGRGLPRK